MILLLDHDEDGALGVVINRPSQLPLRRGAAEWGSVVTAPSMLFSGGPVAPESALAVGLSLGDGPGEGFKRLTATTAWSTSTPTRCHLLADLVGVRVFSGYAGWGAGQLEAEILEGSWYLVDGAAGRPAATPNPKGCGGPCCERQPGELAYVATFPDDPTMN